VIAVILADVHDDQKIDDVAKRAGGGYEAGRILRARDLHDVSAIIRG
jgi:hypothetical protein